MPPFAGVIDVTNTLRTLYRDGIQIGQDAYITVSLTHFNCGWLCQLQVHVRLFLSRCAQYNRGSGSIHVGNNVPLANGLNWRGYIDDGGFRCCL
jgi:hypothetical protein